MPRIKPPRIANHDKLPEIRGDDSDPLWVIRGKNFFLYVNSRPIGYYCCSEPPLTTANFVFSQQGKKMRNI